MARALSRYQRINAAGSRWQPRLSAWLLVVLILIVPLGCGKSKSGSGARPLPDSGFSVEMSAENLPRSLRAKQTVSADVTVKNTSNMSWPSKPNERGLNAVALSYHWRDRRNRLVIRDGLRTPLPGDIAPGESVTVKAEIQAPEERGRYILQLTLVQEGVAWFSERDAATLVVPVRVNSSE